MTDDIDSAGVRRVRSALSDAGIDAEIKVMDRSTHTATQAAEALGCSLAQIAKTLVFIREDGSAVLVIASGPNRVDLTKAGQLAGGTLSKASADQVRSHTGYAIGGVPPIGHPSSLPTVIDRDLLAHPVVWAAGGHPSTLFAIAPLDLVGITGGTVGDVADTGGR